MTDLERASRALMHAVGRVRDDWAEANDQRKQELWQRMHAAADELADVLDNDPPNAAGASDE